MLERVDLCAVLSKEEYRRVIGPLKDRLSALQHSVKARGLPVIVIFEGWSASGKGGRMAEIIRTLDPRYFKTYSTKPPSADEARKPFLWRHWAMVPSKGRFAIFDRSWYPEASTDCVEDRITEAEAARRLSSINKFERQLTDDGALILKFFLHISQDEQKKRLDKLAENQDTAWRVVEADYKRNRHYEKYYDVYDRMIEATDTPNAPWRIISGHDRRRAEVGIYEAIVGSVETALGGEPAQTSVCRGNEQPQVKAHCGNEQSQVKAHYGNEQPQVKAHYGNEQPQVKAHYGECGPTLMETPRLRDVDLTVKLDKGEYKARLKAAKKRLRALHNTLYIRRIPVVIAYEGWDAAGKGGNIKRLTAALDPRGYEVIPVAAPGPAEIARPFLWRFWRTLPKDGHVAIYDRTWYGRVLVERVEGFASEDEWRRAYGEINDFEAELVNWGAVVVKFWLHIDNEEQLRRFNDRQQTPEKRWKITEEDWRNRDKWDIYESAVNDMLRLTGTASAPWHIIESQDKRYARIKAIETVIAAIERRLESE